MEAIVTILILGFCLLVIGAILGFMAYTRVGRLEKEVMSLRQLLVSRDAPVFEKSRPAQPVAAKSAVKTKVAPQPPTPQALPPSTPKPAVLKRNTPDVKAVDTIEVTLQEPKPSLEELIGAKWSVWVGGIALIFGAIFLLRYSIESGFFTPAMRIAMSALFGTALLGAGEFLRRADSRLIKDSAIGASLKENAYIPGVLTAVGIFALLGTVYAAFELYGFISAPLAFILMGAVSLLALGLGLLHGPKLAALGLTASLATPLLIQTTEPNAYGLYGYLTVVSAAALALAHKRKWGWLNIATLAGAMFWIFFSLKATKTVPTHMAWLGFTGLIFAVSTYLATQAPTKTVREKNTPYEYGVSAAVTWAIFAAIAMFAALLLNDFARRHYGIGLGFAALLGVVAIVRPRQSWLILVGGGLGAALVMGATVAKYGQSEILITTILLSAVFVAACVSRFKLTLPPLGLAQNQLIWASAAVLLPLALIWWLSAAYPHYDVNTLSLILAGLSAAFAALSYGTWQWLQKAIEAPSIFALGSAAAYICAAYLGLGGIGETLAFILGIALAGAAAHYLPFVVNRMIAAGFGLLTAAHVLLLQIPTGTAIRETMIFNELWLYFALPAIVCGAVSYLLSRKSADIWSEGLKALAMSFAALFIIFQIRHFMNDGNVLASSLSLDELSLQVLTGLSFTFGASLMTTHSLNFKSPPHAQLVPTLSMAVSAVTFVIFLFGICMGRAPLFNEFVKITGGYMLNSLLLAYLLPSILLGAIAWFGRENRPAIFTKSAAALSLLAFMLYITSMIRFGFQGEEISILSMPHADAELYAISAAWLLTGIALLVIGLKGKRQDLRMASGLIIVMTVLKAFLIDMASLEGVLRAMSFVVLGAVLIVIGRAYQRLLFSKDNSA